MIAKILKFAFSDRKDLSILDIWRRLSHVRASLTDKQEELLQILYLAEPALTYQEASVFLGISLDSVRDREAGILLKFRKEFPELSEFKPYKDWAKNQKRFYTYRGLVHLPSVEIRHPCFRIRNINGQEVRECITGEDHIAHDGFSLKSWIEDFRSPLKKKDSTEFDIDAV